MKLEIHLSATSDTLTQLAAAFLHGIADTEPVIRDVPVDPGRQRAVDPVAIITLILAIPGAALATTQVIEKLRDSRRRNELRKQVDTLLDAINDEHEQVLLIVGKQVIDLSNGSPDKVLDALEAAADDSDAQH